MSAIRARLGVLRALVATFLLLVAGSAQAAFTCPADVFIAGQLGVIGSGNTCGFGSLFSGATCGSGQGSDDFAFAWIAPYTGSFTFDTFGSNYDTALTLRAGDGCAELACNDDVGASLQSLITRRFNQGEEVIVVVDGFSTFSCGDFVLTINGVPDAPVCAFDLGLGSLTGPGVVTGDTCLDDATFGATCGGGMASLDASFRWTAPSTGQWVFDTVGSPYDTGLTVRDGASCSELACDDDAGGNNTSRISTFLLGGQTVNVVVDGFGGGSCGAYQLNIGSEPCPDGDGDGTCNALDGCPSDPAKTSPGPCGCGVPDVNTDGDGLLDCQETCDTDPLKTDPGICGCSVSDINTDGDSLVDCQETCDTDPLKTSPGVCGCSVSDADTDADGVAECIDVCLGSDASGDADLDGLCNDLDIVLSSTPASRPNPLTLSVTGAAPGSTVYFLGTRSGTGSPVCTPSSGLCTDLRNAVVLGTRVADASGNASLSTGSSAKLPVGATLTLQAGWYDAGSGQGEMSNVVTRSF